MKVYGELFLQVMREMFGELGNLIQKTVKHHKRKRPLVCKELASFCALQYIKDGPYLTEDAVPATERVRQLQMINAEFYQMSSMESVLELISLGCVASLR